jgi:hypothetical protein
MSVALGEHLVRHYRDWQLLAGALGDPAADAITALVTAVGPFEEHPDRRAAVTSRMGSATRRRRLSCIDPPCLLGKDSVRPKTGQTPHQRLLDVSVRFVSLIVGNRRQRVDS